MIKANQVKIDTICTKIANLEKNITDCINSIGDKALLTKVDKNSKMIYNIDKDYQHYLNLKTPTDSLPVPENQHDYTVNAEAYNKSADDISSTSSDASISVSLHLNKVVASFRSILDSINKFETTEDIKLNKFSSEYEDSIMSKLVTSIGTLPEVGSVDYPEMTGVVISEEKEVEEPDLPIEPEKTDEVEESGKTGDEENDNTLQDNIVLPIVKPSDNPEGETTEGGETPVDDSVGEEENGEGEETTRNGDGEEEPSSPQGENEDTPAKPTQNDGGEEKSPVSQGGEDEEETPSTPETSEDDPFALPKLKGEENSTNGEEEKTTAKDEESSEEISTPIDEKAGENEDNKPRVITYETKPPQKRDEDNNPFDNNQPINEKPTEKDPKDDMGAFLGLGPVVPHSNGDQPDLSISDGNNPNVQPITSIIDDDEDNLVKKLDIDSQSTDDIPQDVKTSPAIVGTVSSIVVGAVGRDEDDNPFREKNTGSVNKSGIVTNNNNDEKEDDPEKKRKRIASDIRKRVRTALILTGIGITTTVLSCILAGTGVISPFIFIVVAVATIVSAFLFGFNRFLDHLFNLGNPKARVRIFTEIKQNIKDSLVLTGVGIVASIVTYILSSIGLLNPICFAVSGLLTIIMAVIYAYNKFLNGLGDIDSLINESILSENNKELLREFFKSKNGFNIKIFILLVVLLFTLILKLFGKISWLWLLILLLILLIILMIVAISLAKKEEKKSIEK